MRSPHLLPWLQLYPGGWIHPCPLFIQSTLTYSPDQIESLEEQYIKRKTREDGFEGVLAALGWKEGVTFRKIQLIPYFLSAEFFVRGPNKRGNPIRVWALDPESGFFVRVQHNTPEYQPTLECLRGAMPAEVQPVFFPPRKAKDNPTKSRTFTPSYPVDSAEDYRKRLESCEGSEGKGPGCKREYHIQVEGGREAVRRRGQEVPPMGEGTASRLATASPWFSARTQAEKLPRDRRAKATLEEKIREAITRYRSGAGEPPGGFRVPHHPVGLVQAGMPLRAAELLVRRAAGAFFPEEVEAVFKPPTVLALLTKAMRGVFVMYGGGSLGIQRPGDIRPVPVLAILAVTGKDAVRTLFLRRSYAKTYLERARGALGVVPPIIEDAYDRFREDRERGGYDYRADEFGAFFVSILGGSLESSAQKLKAKAIILLVGDPAAAGQIVAPLGEHSKLAAAVAAKTAVRYRNLSNVSLSSLPRLLAGISKRKRHKGT